MHELTIRPTIVVGCQRSGTLLATHIINDLLEGIYIDEAEFYPFNVGIKLINEISAKGLKNTVVHCPCALDCWQKLHSVIPNVRWVGVTRNKEDILASMKRIQWVKEDHEDDWEEYLDWRIEDMKQKWEDLKQTISPEDWRELKYEDMKSHPFYVSKEKRKDFYVKQWKEGEPAGPKYWNSNDECLAKLKQSLK